jgi:inner membrane protein
MHTTGHVGIGFGVAAPVAIGLEAGGVGALALPATAVLVGLSTLPDVDHHLPRVAHRGATHSLAFALLVGFVVSVLGWLAGPVGTVSGGTVALVGLAVGALAVAGHLIADVCTPMGVAPAWPLSKARYSLRIVPSANARANIGLLVTGVGLWVLTVGVRVGP